MSVRRLRLIDEPSTAADAREPALRIAIATQDMKGLNAHFGSARKFAIYDVSASGAAFVEAVAFDKISPETGEHKDDGDDRITPKVEALAGVKLLFVRAIGGPAAAKIVRANIHPVKIADPMPIEAVIERVQGMLRSNPPPWLRKVIAEAGITRKQSFTEESA